MLILKQQDYGAVRCFKDCINIIQKLYTVVSFPFHVLGPSVAKSRFSILPVTLIIFTCTVYKTTSKLCVCVCVHFWF
jgi:hypothetical protein